MKTIWKYTIVVTDLQIIAMPVDAEILTVGLQNNIPCIWVLVDPDAPMEDRRIEIFGTGNPIPYKKGITNKKYIGTFQQNWKASTMLFVWHVFENKEYIL